jgi:hypothetical protein
VNVRAQIRIASAALLFIGAGGLVAGAIGSAMSLEWLRTVGTGVILLGTGLGSATALVVDRSASTDPGSQGPLGFPAETQRL